MPPTDEAKIPSYKKSYGFIGSRMEHVKWYRYEVEEIQAKGLKIHAFYVHNAAKEAFEWIAKTTGGNCGPLDINSEKGAETLTAIVTESILADIGQKQGKGNDLVMMYRKQYT